MSAFRVAVRNFGPFESAIVKQWRSFCAAGGGDLEIEPVSLDLEHLHAAVFKDRGQGWDLLFLPTDWVAAAVTDGLLADLRPLMAARPIADFPEAWSPSLLGLQDFAGGFWGMPYHDGPQCLIYRSDLLRDAGLAVPQTWEAFHDAARRLHDPVAGRAGTILALFPDGHNSFYDFCVQLWTRGGAPFDAAGRPTLTTGAAREGLDFLRRLAADRAATDADMRDIDSVASGMRFAAGRVALMANWFGFAAYAETAADSAVRGRVGVAPLPSGTGGGAVSLNVFWLLAIPAASARRDLAWDFMRHCATPAMDKLVTQEGAIGVRRSTWNDAEVNRAVPFYHQLDGLHAVARTLPLHPRMPEVAQAIDAMMTDAVTTNQATDDLLARAQARIAAIVA